MADISTIKWYYIRVVSIEVGLSLMAIREWKKYRDVGYKDFQVYIEER
jgi:hypothetical protein